MFREASATVPFAEVVLVILSRCTWGASHEPPAAWLQRVCPPLQTSDARAAGVGTSRAKLIGNGYASAVRVGISDLGRELSDEGPNRHRSVDMHSERGRGPWWFYGELKRLRHLLLLFAPICPAWRVLVLSRCF
jgi:hypothetical protein